LCTLFYLCHTQGGVHIKASTPINRTAIKATVPKKIAAQPILLIMSPNCLLEGYQEPSVISC